MRHYCLPLPIVLNWFGVELTMRSLSFHCGLLFCLLLCFTLAIVAISKQAAWSAATSARIWTGRQYGPVRLRFGENQLQSMPESLPPLPFTVEIVARFSNLSATGTVWGILLNVYSRQPSDILLTNDRHFFAPSNDRAAYFYGLHPAGQFNQLRLAIAVDKQATLTLNGAVVWQGAVYFESIPGQWALFAVNSNRHVAVLTWLHIDLYQSLPIGP